MNNFSVFHLITTTTNNMFDFYKIIKYGILSPKALFDIDKKLFELTSFKNYKKRTASFLKKNEKDVKLEDVITFLDNAPIRTNKGFNSSTIFFHFVSFHEINKEFQKLIAPCFELTIDINYLKKFTPILVYSHCKKIKWSDVDEDFLNFVRKEAKSPIKNYSKIHSQIPHLAIPDIYKIDKKYILDQKYFKR